MTLTETFTLREFLDRQQAAEIGGAHYDLAADRLNTRHVSDTRKPKLTLRHLNRLRQLRALQRLETMKRADLLGVMYAPAEPEPGGPGGGGMGF